MVFCKNCKKFTWVDDMFPNMYFCDIHIQPSAYITNINNDCKDYEEVDTIRIIFCKNCKNYYQYNDDFIRASNITVNPCKKNPYYNKNENNNCKDFKCKDFKRKWWKIWING